MKRLLVILVIISIGINQVEAQGMNEVESGGMSYWLLTIPITIIVLFIIAYRRNHPHAKILNKTIREIEEKDKKK